MDQAVPPIGELTDLGKEESEQGAGGGGGGGGEEGGKYQELGKDAENRE